MLTRGGRLNWLWLVILVAGTATADAASAERPNVVLILIDDLSHYGVTAYGADRLSEWSGLFANRKISTPNIDRVPLQHSIVPADATRQNVIWESSDPQVATIDKFGVLTARAPGRVEICIYSWDDANPSSANTRQTFSRAGIRGTIRIRVAFGAER